MTTINSFHANEMTGHLVNFLSLQVIEASLRLPFPTVCSHRADIRSHGADICPQVADLYSHGANRDLSGQVTGLLFVTYIFFFEFTKFIPYIRHAGKQVPDTIILATADLSRNHHGRKHKECFNKTDAPRLCGGVQKRSASVKKDGRQQQNRL